MSQLDRIVCAPKYLLGQIISSDSVSAGGIILPPTVQKPTNVWKVLKVGAGIDKFPDVKPGDLVIPEKQTPVTVDRTPLSMVFEDWIFGIIPEGTVGTQLERIVLAPRYLLAKLVVQKGTDTVIMPTTATSFWMVVKTGRALETFPGLAVGDLIVPEKHAAISIDNGQQYGVIHESWCVAMMPKVPTVVTETAPASASTEN